MTLKLLLTMLSASITVNCAAVPLTAPTSQKLLPLKNTQGMKVIPQHTLMKRPVRPRLAPIRGSLHESIYEDSENEYNSFSDFKNIPEPKISGFSFNPNHLRNPNLPRFEELIYSGIAQIFNGGYFYAIDAKNTEFSAGQPGILRYKNSNIYDYEVDELYSVAMYENDGRQACEALKELLELDGLRADAFIPAKQLSAPHFHYIAVVIPNRDVTTVNYGQPYEPRYFRLNADGEWSFKIGSEVPQKLDIPPFSSMAEASDELTRLAFPNDKGLFCGFYEVTQNMKYKLEARMRRQDKRQ